MKKIFTLLAFVGLSVASYAQLNGSGYYRAMNANTQRYIYVIDDKGFISVQANAADTKAIQLRKGKEHVLDNPSSVLYGLSKGGNLWDLQAQGSGVYGIIGINVTVKSFSEDGGNPYEVSGTTNGQTVYLVDKEQEMYEEYGKLDIGGSTYKRWMITPMDQTENYLGITPNIQVNSKYYSSYYVSFPFSFHSEGMEAYYVTKVDTKNNVVVIKEVEGIVQKSMPVIVECSTAAAETNKLELQDYTKHNEAPADNLLSGVYFSLHNHMYENRPCGYTEYDPKTMRILSSVNGKLAYVNAAENKDLLNYQAKTVVYDEQAGQKLVPKYLLKANQSYLKVAEGTADVLYVLTEAEYAEKYPPVPETVPGDVTGDGTVDIQDCSSVLNIFLNGSGSADTKAADLNNDGVVDIQDVSIVLNAFLSSK